MSLGKSSRVKLIMLKNNCAECYTCIIKCRMIKELFMKKVMSLVTILKHGRNIGISLSKSSSMKSIILNNKCPNTMLASSNVGFLQDIYEECKLIGGHLEKWPASWNLVLQFEQN